MVQDSAFKKVPEENTAAFEAVAAWISHWFGTDSRLRAIGCGRRLQYLHYAVGIAARQRLLSGQERARPDHRLLADFPQLQSEFIVLQELAVRSIWTQYRESDLEFLLRVLAAEGLSWRFEHDQGEADSGADRGQAHARYKVVFFDSAAALPATPGGDMLRFHGVRATDTDDGIDRFAARRWVAANAITISSWDPAQLMAPAATSKNSKRMARACWCAT